MNDHLLQGKKNWHRTWLDKKRKWSHSLLSKQGPCVASWLPKVEKSNKKFLKKERSMRMDTEPLPTNQARPLMYIPIIKIYTCKYIFGCMKIARCYNLVLVIKDQATTRVTIDNVKKKQTNPGVSSYS